MVDNQSKPFLGTGWAFPVETNGRGEISLVSSEKDIEQAIRIILGTRPGERVMRPTFGCRAHELIFEPVDATTSSLLKSYVQEALEFWEPRIHVLSVEVSIDDENEGTVLVELQYRIKATHDVRSIVYPFYLAGEES